MGSLYLLQALSLWEAGMAMIDKSMLEPEPPEEAGRTLIRDTIQKLAKKAGCITSHLEQPTQYLPFLYEFAIAAVAPIVGPQALHDFEEYKTEEARREAMDAIHDEIDRALNDRKH
jgi:hypothetical protein